MSTSHLEQKFSDMWLDLYPTIDLHSEYQFTPPRKFRWDFAHLPTKTAIDIQGAIWVQSGHTHGKGILRDYEKLNLASSQGWRVYLLAESMITRYWLNMIAATINPELGNVQAYQQLKIEGF